MASLRGFGSANRESLAELVWAFFEYWAWRHNYSSDVVSIRLGACLHKDDKDWTRRIGNERHLVGGASGSWVRAVEAAGLPRLPGMAAWEASSRTARSSPLWKCRSACHWL